MHPFTHSQNTAIKLHPFLSAAVAAPAARCTPSLTTLHCNKAAPFSISSSGSTSCKMHSFTHNIAIVMHPSISSSCSTSCKMHSLTHSHSQQYNNDAGYVSCRESKLRAGAIQSPEVVGYPTDVDALAAKVWVQQRQQTHKQQTHKQSQQQSNTFSSLQRQSKQISAGESNIRAATTNARAPVQVRLSDLLTRLRWLFIAKAPLKLRFSDLLIRSFRLPMQGPLSSEAL